MCIQFPLQGKTYNNEMAIITMDEWGNPSKIQCKEREIPGVDST